jgi:hypothetical protein
LGGLFCFWDYFNHSAMFDFNFMLFTIKNGITFTTMIDDKKIIKKHFEIKSIETIFGGNK